MKFGCGHHIQLRILTKSEKVQMRATKQSSIKHSSYVERLKYLRLPTLHYRRIRGAALISLTKTKTKIVVNENTLHSLTKTKIETKIHAKTKNKR